MYCWFNFYFVFSVVFLCIFELRSSELPKHGIDEHLKSSYLLLCWLEENPLDEKTKSQINAHINKVLENEINEEQRLFIEEISSDLRKISLN